MDAKYEAVDMPDMEDILFEEPLDARPSNGHAHQV